MFQRCSAQDGSLIRGSKRRAAALELQQASCRCIEMIERVLTNYHRQKTDVVTAVNQRKVIVDIGHSSNDEEADSSGNRINVPQEQLAPMALRSMGASWWSAVSAACVVPEHIAGEPAAEGRGLHEMKLNLWHMCVWLSAPSPIESKCCIMQQRTFKQHCGKMCPLEPHSPPMSHQFAPLPRAPPFRRPQMLCVLFFIFAE